LARDIDRQGDRPGGGGDHSEEPEERTDGWMTTYADMVTLLMTFFVLMFAISNVDNEKAALMFAAFSREGLTAEEYIEIQEKWGKPSEDPDDIRIPTPAPTPSPSPAPGEDDLPIGNPELDKLFNLVDEYINENGLGDRMALQFNGEYLMLTLANDIWFSSGSSEITSAMRATATEIALLLAQTFNEEKPFDIVVAGHTDNVPISTARYPSNWHLSKDRAVNFLEVLISESNLDPYYFYARACGEERPVASNDTAEGRQRNRRVEVMISLARDEPIWLDDHPYEPE
jgi:chemotaxis protein MotB